MPVPTWVNEQELAGLNEPVAVPAFAKLTEPAGNDFVPVSVSETVAVQVTESLIGVEDGKQETLVEVDRFVTVNANPVESELSACTASLAV